MIMEEAKVLCKAIYEKQHGFVIIDLNRKNTAVNIKVNSRSLTCQIRLKTKQLLFYHYKMKNLLKQIVDNTKPMRSFSIGVRYNKLRLKTWIKSSIQLDRKKDYEIALINLETYYSFPNMDKSNNCLVIYLVQTHHGLTLLFLRQVITLKILVSLFNEK